MKHTKLFSLFLSMLVLCSSLNAQTTDLVTNGNFAGGSLMGWTVQTQSPNNGHWVTYPGNTLPLSSNTFFLPPEGGYAAAFDQTGNASSVMYQDVAIPAGKAILSFTYYYRNYNGIDIPNPDTLDDTVIPNQQFRFDIMNPSADPFSVAPGDVVLNLVQLAPGDPTALIPTHCHL